MITFCLMSINLLQLFAMKSSMSDIGRTIEEIRLLKRSGPEVGDGIVPLQLETATRSSQLKDLEKELSENLVRQFTVFALEKFDTFIQEFKTY